MARHPINLPALSADYQAAQARCPHWDFDNPDGGWEPCCREMNAAEDAYRAGLRVRGENA